MNAADFMIGQRETVQLLTRLAALGKFPAAVLLTGAPGIGKTTLAEHLACQLLSCADPAALPAHPDLLRLKPLDDQPMRERLSRLLRQVHESPAVALVRVVLLTDVDRLSLAAQSLLLKTIEDAPSAAKMLLTAVSLERVAPTIRSRALGRSLHPLSDAEMTRVLRDTGIPSGETLEVARLSGGRPGLALRLAHDAILLHRYRRWAGGEGLPETSEEAEEFLIFVQSQLRRHPRSPFALRRGREALAMVRQHVPVPFVVEYVLGSLA